MLAAAGSAFVLTVLVDWLLGLRFAAELSGSDSMATYPIAQVLTGLIGRAALLCITFVVALYSLVRGLLPQLRDRTEEDDLSHFDRFANWVVLVLGGLQRHVYHSDVTTRETVADGARRQVFRIVRPTQVVFAWVLLVVGAMAIGLNAGHYVAYRLIEGQINESAPVWRANLKGDREWLLQRWLNVTGTRRTEFNGGSDDAALMEWLRQSPKKDIAENTKFEATWRDSFSRLIGRSNWLLTVLATVPLGINLLAFLVTSARIDLPSGDISRRLMALPAGGNKTCRDLVDEIRRWNPEPQGPPRPVSNRSDQVQRASRRINDEVWFVSVHTLSQSSAMLNEADIGLLSTRLGRTVRALDARTHASRKALMRAQSPGLVADEQPSCVLYVVHAPASPTKDLIDFIAEMGVEFPLSFKAILLADRSDKSARERNARDELWRATVRGEDGAADVVGGHHVITSVDTRSRGEMLCGQLAMEIDRIVSPHSGVLLKQSDTATTREDHNQRLINAFDVIAKSLAYARTLEGNDFGERLGNLLGRTEGELRQIFSDDPFTLRGGAAAALRIGEARHEHAVDVVKKANRQAHSTVYDIAGRLQGIVWRAATALSAFAILTVFTGIIPLTFIFGSMAATAWGIYAIVAVFQSQLTPFDGAHQNDELPIEEKAEQLTAFTARLVSSVCSFHGRNAEDGGQLCRTAATQWKHRSPHDRLPGEAELRECWTRCFPNTCPI